MDKTHRNYVFWGLLGVVLIMVGVRLEVIGAYADSMPYWDDFTIGGLLYFYQTDTMEFYHLVKDSNEHRLVFNRLLSLLFFEMNQNQWDPKIGMVTNTAIWALSGYLLLRITLKNLPITRAGPVVMLVFLLWCLPIALVNIVWGVQTHTYTMILFIILGCWGITAPALSKAWWGGFLSLLCAPLTLAGGTFAGCAVFALALLMLLRNKFKGRDDWITGLAALAAALFGLALIVFQPGSIKSPDDMDWWFALSTLLKTLSWPLADVVWPAFFLGLPIALLLLQVLIDPSKLTRLARFTLTLYLTLFVIALAIAYSRGWGNGPSRRYFDYLALMPVCSALALMQVSIGIKESQKWLIHSLTGAIVVILALSVPLIHYTFTFTVKDQEKVKAAHQMNVMSYLNTWDKKWLLNRGFRGVPFPREKDLVWLLKDYNDVDMLPYQLQTRQQVIHDQRQTKEEMAQAGFVYDGTVIRGTGNVGTRPFGEPVFGSYIADGEKEKATGTFTSHEFHHNRDYIALQVFGYFGYPGLSLKFVEYGSGKEYVLKPPKIKHAREISEWRYVRQRLPKGYYRIVAEDNSEEHWFGFATPKSVGPVSHRIESLIDNAKWLWVLGIAILFFRFRHVLLPLSTSFSTAKSGVSE